VGETEYDTDREREMEGGRERGRDEEEGDSIKDPLTYMDSLAIIILFYLKT
jgi:hypothetical protein